MSQIFKKNAYLLTVHVGTGGNDNVGEFTMSLINGHLPAVRSERTGKTFALDWTDITNQAIEAGIFNEDEPTSTVTQ